MDVPGGREVRILLANNELPPYGGLGSWTHTIVDELVKRGIEVDVWTAGGGQYAERIGRQTCEGELLTRGSYYYDLALVQHGNICEWLIENRLAKHNCLTLHGKDYHGDRSCEGADSYVTITQELADHFGDGWTVINAPIDMAKYKPTRPISDELGVVGLLSNYRRADPLVRQACELYGCDFKMIGGNRATWDTVGAINTCDLVVAVGRGALEAMACGRSVVIYDDRSYYPACSDGYFLPENGAVVRKSNYTGRHFELTTDANSMAAMFRHYHEHSGLRNRMYCWANHGVEHIVTQYLKLGGLE